MAVTLRLTRMGANKKPFYRIVAADSRAPRDGRLIEQLGYYNPLTEPPEIKVDLERVDYWIGVGAQPSDTVSQLVAKARKQACAADAQPAGE
jgi:small subunit ribosomal protein S16